MKLARVLFAVDAGGRLATVKGYALTDDYWLRAEIIERIMCDLSRSRPDLRGTDQRRSATIFAPPAGADFRRRGEPMALHWP
jgi:hypothetical protein